MLVICCYTLVEKVSEGLSVFVSLPIATHLHQLSSNDAPLSLPTFQDSATSSASQSVGPRDTWEKILEEHLVAHKPAKQVFIGAGLPVLPNRLVDKMVAGEYINFNELIPFCDPGAEEEPTATSAPEHYLFPSLGVIRPGHKIEYSFLQGVSCFITYMAALSSNGQNVTHMYTYFNVILKANREYTDDMWKPRVIPTGQ